MEIALLWVLVGLVLVNIFRSRKTQPALREKAVKAVAPPEVHRLIHTWVEIENKDGWYTGWRYKCSCGHFGASPNCTKTTLGSEAGAIERFKAHAEGYREANRNPLQEKLDAVRAEFDSFKQKCYCQETHTEIKALEGK